MSEQAIVRSPAAHHPPEAFNDMELWTLTRQPFHPQLRMGREHLFPQGPTRPGRIVNRDNDFGIRTRRIGTSDVPEVRRKRHLQALVFALARLGFAARRLLPQAGGQLSGHHMQRRHTIHLILVIPCPHGGAIALHPQRGPSRRHPRKAGFVLAQHHARPGLGFFFHASSSSRAMRCSSGFPRQ
jgi:hypothetical protein